MKLSGLMLLVVGLAAGCDPSGIPGPPAELEHAAVTRSCGPADGPAVAIFLVPTPMTALPAQTPYVRVYIAQPLASLEGRRWALSGPDAEGAAWRHATAGEFEVATWGVLTVNEVTDESTVEGEVNLVFPSGRHVWGGFRAIWFETDIFCG